MEPGAAKASTSQPPQPDKFIAMIEYSKLSYGDLAELFGRVNGDLQRAQFELTGPCKNVGQQAGKIEFRYVHMQKSASTKEVLTEIEKRGLRPATHEELVGFASQFPEEQRRFPIVELGSVWRNGHDSCSVIHQRGKDGLRWMGLARTNGVWLDSCRFLAVPK